ncbi:MAG: hypothetical protein EHM58_04470 [Ignavibacteriae bacterium]|nr:MAG: hypothetical protein EHM58_04470 [Ignavibacteriota bacterium]
MKKLIYLILTFFLIQVAVLYSQCTTTSNTSGEITWTYIQYQNNSVGYKIIDTDLDSLETDTSSCFQSAQMQKLIPNYNVGYDSVGYNNLLPIYYTIQVKGVTVGGSTKDGINAYLVGKMYDETAWTVIDTLTTSKRNLWQDKLSILGSTGGTLRYPIWGIKLYGVNTNSTTIVIYIWTNSPNRPGGGGSGEREYFVNPNNYKQ